MTHRIDVHMGDPHVKQVGGFVEGCMGSLGDDHFGDVDAFLLKQTTNQCFPLITTLNVNFYAVRHYPKPG